MLQKQKSKLVQETESYKVRLKKSELIFNKQYEAAIAMAEIIRTYVPSISDPDMTWDDACDAMAQDFGYIIDKLEKFLIKYHPIIDKETRLSLNKSIGCASRARLKVDSMYVSKLANSVANDVYESLTKAEEKLTIEVTRQTRT